MSPRFGGGGGADRDADARQRSADERERARQEREARRAAREGRPPRELPPLPAEPPRAAAPAAEPESALEPPSAGSPPGVGGEPTFSVPEEPAAAPEPAWTPEPEPTYEPEPTFDPKPTYEPEPTFESETVYEPEPATEPLSAGSPPPRGGEPTFSVPGEPEPEPAWEPVPVESAWAPATHEEPAVVVQGREEAPVGVKRVAGSAMASAAGASGPPRFGAPPRGVPKRRRGARRVLPLLLLAVVAAAGFFAYRLYEPGADAGTERVAVTIPQGASAEQIGDLLAEQDVVSSGFFFSLRARLDGENLRSGPVDLKRGMSYEAALAELTKAAPPAPVLAKVTLPEGPGREEFAGTVRDAGFKGSYTKATERSNVLDPRDYGAPRGASLEGFLFPATYELKPGSSAKALVNEQLRAFKREFAKLDLTVAKRRNLSRFDVLTIASMIEREALVPKDRRLIAGVIYNRLQQGMPLGIDATIRYELDNFSRPLRVSELERDTPYNTRTRQGLPLGPIGNPGLASLRAAANPARNDFVYYVVKPCANGAHAFSSTDAGFQRDVAAYNAKRDELGGKDPSQC